ncbi:MAG: hypothetical protein IMZ62_00345 [Chloroflexi bacterium]|nr:hypothetical protein [Chloroflexota bacterium]
MGLALGKSSLDHDVPPDMDLITPRPASTLPDPRQRLQDTLRDPIGLPPLCVLVHPKDKDVTAHIGLSRAGAVRTNPSAWIHCSHPGSAWLKFAACKARTAAPVCMPLASFLSATASHRVK